MNRRRIAIAQSRRERRSCAVVTACALAACSGTRTPVDSGADASFDSADVRDAAMDTYVADATDSAMPDVHPDVPMLRVPFTWIGVLGTGQSLSVGAEGVPRSHAITRFQNLTLSDPRDRDGGFRDFDAGIQGLTVVPLHEPARRSVAGSNGLYPNNLGGETPHTTMADEVSALALANHGQSVVTAHSIVGISGQPLVALSPTGVTNSYGAALYEANALTQLAHGLGETFGYGAIVMTHGESDALNADYGTQLYAFWQQYDRDLRRITGQTRTIPMLVSQQSSVPWPTGPADPARSTSTLAQWRLGVEHPGEFYCVGPKYQYPPSIAVIHLSPEGYRALGIKYGEVLYEVAVEQHAWQPLQPTRVSRSGPQIVLDFHVPYPPLQWDPNIAPPHAAGLPHAAWANGRGFEVADSTGDLRIASATLRGDQVVLELASTPTGSGLVVRYAMTPERWTWSNGPVNGRRGQLRDADPLVGIDVTTVRCQLTRGSTAVIAAPPANFDALGERELVSGAGLPADTIVTTIESPMSVTLSAVWSAASTMLQWNVGSRGNVHFALTLGSDQAMAWGFDNFSEVEAGDLITGTNAPAGLSLRAVQPRTHMTLSAPWSAATATVDLAFRSEQRNYCVQFELPVP